MDAVSKLLKPDTAGGFSLRVDSSEIGGVGLKVLAKHVYEESERDLRFPNIVNIVDKMKKDPTIASALQLYRIAMGRVRWKVVPPPGADKRQIERAKFINSCMNDMEHSFSSFIYEALSYLEYGFAIHEKVYRKRLKRHGSKYNDGLIGWRKLPPRSQNTIEGFVYDEDRNNLLAIEQKIVGKQKVEIPVRKVLHFVADPQRNNPVGNTPLKAVYLPWRYRILIEENEALGVTRDLGGIPVVHIPPRYMSPEASPQETAVYEYYKNIIRNIHSNQQAGLVLPAAYDPESRQPLFKFELLSSQGGKAYDTGQIITRYENKMLMCLFADILKLGQDKVGSFALAAGKNSILSMALSYRLKEIADVLNFDLIPQTFEMNGWDDTEFPQFVWEDLEEIDLEAFSAAIQRIAATGMVEVDRQVLNKVRKSLGVDEYPVEKPVQWDILSNSSSRSGDSLNTPSGGLNGTAKDVSKNDKSVSNKEN